MEHGVQGSGSWAPMSNAITIVLTTRYSLLLYCLIHLRRAVHDHTFWDVGQTQQYLTPFGKEGTDNKKSVAGVR